MAITSTPCAVTVYCLTPWRCRVCVYIECYINLYQPLRMDRSDSYGNWTGNQYLFPSGALRRAASLKRRSITLPRASSIASFSHLSAGRTEAFRENLVDPSIRTCFLLPSPPPPGRPAAKCATRLRRRWLMTARVTRANINGHATYRITA